MWAVVRLSGGVIIAQVEGVFLDLEEAEKFVHQRAWGVDLIINKDGDTLWKRENIIGLVFCGE